MTTKAKQYENRNVLMAMAVGIALFAALASVSPLGAGAYMIWSGSTAGGVAAVGGGLASIGGALTAYSAASTIGTAAAVGIGLTGVGGALALA